MKNILNYKKPPFWMALISILTLIIIAILLLTYRQRHNKMNIFNYGTSYDAFLYDRQNPIYDDTNMTQLPNITKHIPIEALKTLISYMQMDEWKEDNSGNNYDMPMDVMIGSYEKDHYLMFDNVNGKTYFEIYQPDSDVYIRHFFAPMQVYDDVKNYLLSLEDLPPNEVIHSIDAKIINIEDNTLLIASVLDDAKPTDIYKLSLKDCSFVNSKRKAMKTKDLEVGMLLKISYKNIEETYVPVLHPDDSIQIIGKEDNLATFYLSIIDEIYRMDSALNHDISKIAFDFTELKNLRETEKNALSFELGNKYQLDVLEGSFEELCNEGYIDKSKLYFKDGILITVSDTKMTNDSDEFNFSISKWRSGIGAVGYDNCTAIKENGSWTYTLGISWIS